MGNETWIQEKEKIALFSQAEGRGAEAARLLERNENNRIVVDSNQAKVLMVLRFAGARFNSWYPEAPYKYSWITNLAELVESHQLTMQGESRFEFARVAIAQGIAKIINRAKQEMEALTQK